MIDTLYTLYDPNGKLISHGADPVQLWIDAIDKQYPDIVLNEHSRLTNVATLVNLMLAGYTLSKYRRVE